MSKFQNYVPQPFAFYKEMTAGDRQYQNYNLNQCSGDLSTWRLIVVADLDDPQLRIPPFQIKRATSLGSPVLDFTLIRLDGTLADIPLSTAAFSVENLNTTPTLDSIIFSGAAITLALDDIPTGQFYVTVSDGTNTWYSEIFEVEDESAIDPTFPAACGGLGWARLEWSNSACIISETIHNDAPSFQLLLPVDLGQPGYDYKPESEEDGQGGKVTTFHRLEKRWSFFIVAPEYIADALTATQMMSSVVLNFESGDFMTCRDIEVEVDWSTPCLAKITYSFSSDILSKTACCV